ncbi:MAG TPA: hypothetical protein PLI45_01915 [Candidatus Woesebacteria bacterium]|nr:hypothetical protein [Candidatus Woesebacteria bacterium]
MNFLSLLLLITIPAIYFYPFGVLSLLFSLLLAFFLKKIFDSGRFPYLLLFFLLLIVSFVISGHHLYNDMAIINVANSQRGEHLNFQTNLFAKLLHNKSLISMYYLQNLSDRLSLSTIFASGMYPNISKFLPLGFLFPWYLVGFLVSVKSDYRKYLSPIFIIAISALFLLTAILTQSSAQIFMFAIIWFVGFESVLQIGKLPKPWAFLCLVLNLTYLGIFFLSYKSFLV